MTATDADRAKAAELWHEIDVYAGHEPKAAELWHEIDVYAGHEPKAAIFLISQWWAAERAAVTDAVTRPLLALAEEMEAAARLPVLGEFDRGVAAHPQDAATRLRAAVAAALGGEQRD